LIFMFRPPNRISSSITVKISLKSLQTRLQSWKSDLNRRPTDYGSVALPTALFQHAGSSTELLTYEIIQKLMPVGKT
jgi:hypothetical protein